MSAAEDAVTGAATKTLIWTKCVDMVRAGGREAGPYMSCPGVVRTKFKTAEPEQARQYLLDQGATDVKVEPAGLDRFRFSLESVDEGTIGVREFEHTGAVAVTSVPNETYRALVVAEGSVRVFNGRRTLTLVAGESALIGPRPLHRVQLQACRIRVVRIAAAHLRRGLTEVDPAAGAALEVALLRPRSAAEARQIAATTAFIRHEVLSRPDGPSAEVLAAARQLVAATLISAFAPRPWLKDDARPSEEISATLRRALNYIEAHARESLTLEEIASSARVRPRTLQELFGKQLGTSPFVHLQHVRLAGARAELLSARPEDGAAVAPIATRWGFTGPGHFAAAYRRQYGELPRETLRR
ncbi:MAG TPA: AraC family transcriptional regulator [Jatrophihabitans sp.]|nr:AraC family transcriptional regulator [Jatrophihabitans sp.]